MKNPAVGVGPEGVGLRGAIEGHRVAGPEIANHRGGTEGGVGVDRYIGGPCRSWHDEIPFVSLSTAGKVTMKVGGEKNSEVPPRRSLQRRCGGHPRAALESLERVVIVVGGRVDSARAVVMSESFLSNAALRSRFPVGLLGEFSQVAAGLGNERLAGGVRNGLTAAQGDQLFPGGFPGRD